MTSRSSNAIQLALVALACMLVLGCRADTTGLGTLTLAQVNGRLVAGDDFVMCDANSADTRSKLGVIAGATLLSSYRDYDVSSELPIDRARMLVFYCHSPYCTAAADAARRAVGAGYQEVFVMPEGIKGWVEARLPVVRPDAG